jgi:RNA polymerase sigma factor (TIGR02999 family)
MVSGREPGEVTRLLDSWGTGSDAALDELMPLVYSELRTIAAGQLRGERADHTLQATALVNEAFLRLINQDRVLWQNRGHFFAVAAKAMRRILVDHARRRSARKRGGNDRRVPLDGVDIAVAAEVDLLELEGSLSRLEALDPRQARIVELRFFAGCTMEEVAETLGISVSTAKRQWRLARVWLRGELDRESARGS